MGAIDTAGGARRFLYRRIAVWLAGAGALSIISGGPREKRRPGAAEKAPCESFPRPFRWPSKDVFALCHERAREALLPPALGAVPVTTVTAHSLDYCFAVIAPSCGASCLSSEELRAADLAALFRYRHLPG